MIKLLDILENKILIPRRSAEERTQNHMVAIQKQIQQYIKDGSQGGLDLSGTPIRSLPQGLQVDGSLYLSGTPIESLPQGLRVGGSLYLRGTQIRSLPQGLRVRGFLDLRDTPIRSLPQGLQVDGGLDLQNTPLSETYTEQEIRQMVPGVKGRIYT